MFYGQSCSGVLFVDSMTHMKGPSSKGAHGGQYVQSSCIKCRRTEQNRGYWVERGQRRQTSISRGMAKKMRGFDD